jgi:malonyl-CoA decarboxylase
MNTSRTRAPSESGGDGSSGQGPVARRRGALDMLMNSGLGKMLRGIGVAPRQDRGESLLDLADALLSLRGRASGPALASAFFDLYEASDLETRQDFLGKIHDLHPADAEAIDKAIAAWTKKRDEASALALNAASKSPSRRLINQLNLAPQGTQRLIGLREDLLAVPRAATTPGLAALDRDLENAFTAWFNAGFLELRRIGWDSSAQLLERIIRYEAVHQIQGWDDLRRRVEPADRRCYGFFHPQMRDDPLIFVEVALTAGIPGAIHEIISEEREGVDPRDATCAIFYSISNCQVGLKGIPFGNHLIKRVVGLLKDELPHLKTFATLSPVPGFARWLAKERDGAAPVPGASELRQLAARYLVGSSGNGEASGERARSGAGKVSQPLDPVARFHLGNGARLEAVHANADLSANGQKQSHGVMVNYLYELADIEANVFALNELGTVATSKSVQALLEPEPAARKGKAAKDAVAA